MRDRAKRNSDRICTKTILIIFNSKQHNRLHIIIYFFFFSFVILLSSKQTDCVCVMIFSATPRNNLRCHMMRIRMANVNMWIRCNKKIYLYDMSTELYKQTALRTFKCHIISGICRITSFWCSYFFSFILSFQSTISNILL